MTHFSLCDIMKTKPFLLILVAGLAMVLSARPVVVGLVDDCASNGLAGVKGEYARAVYAAGAVPYVLPATTNAEVLAALVDRVDLVLLCGGEDVEPRRYGETPHANLGKVNLRRDAWEFTLLDEATRRRKPLLGICRGCQVLNVHFGGTLWQDVPTELDGAPVHRLTGEHPVALEAGSRLATLLGTTETSVNSRHHQAAKACAAGFKVAARSPDGVVEAIEGASYPALGVQFHPESLFVRSGRREFLPLFRGDFADLKPAARTGGRMRRLVAIPDYCATNGQVVAKSNLTQALEMAGLVSVIIPFTTDDAQLEAALQDADALLVGGGVGKLQDYPRRCAFEHRCIALAVRRGIPVSGICHGSQVINTYFGGTLEATPQFAGKHDALVLHRMPVRTPPTDNFHLAELEPGSRIAALFASARAVINSSHSMRSHVMGTGLKVTARGLDGVVEAFEHETLPIMAFQFHPERMTYDARFVELLRAALSPATRR